MRQTPEADFQKSVIEWAHMFHWKCFYLPDWMYRMAMASMRRKRRGDRDWPDPGFPDLVLIKHGHLLLVELKAPKGRVSTEQKEWHELFASVGLVVHVWKPDDIDDIIMLLSQT